MNNKLDVWLEVHSERKSCHSKWRTISQKKIEGDWHNATSPEWMQTMRLLGGRETLADNGNYLRSVSPDGLTMDERYYQGAAR